MVESGALIFCLLLHQYVDDSRSIPYLMKKNIFAINGSASKNSSNLKLLNRVSTLTEEDFNLIIFNGLSELPHFNPELSIENTPQIIVDIRNQISNADGVLICTPEYIFSIPSGLKNLIEWCVSTTIFSRKPLGFITASANGEKGHEELKLIMETIDAMFTTETTLLIQGVKGKFDESGNMIDVQTEKHLNNFLASFKILIMTAKY